MKKILLPIILLLNTSVFAEMISVQGRTSYFPRENGTGVTIKSIEQYPEGLLVVTSNLWVGTYGWGPVPPIVMRASNTLDLNIPSIAVYDVITEAEDNLQDRIPGLKLYDTVGPDVVIPFDMDLLNDWIDVIGFGRISIKNYPWIIHEDLGVFYISESHYVNDSLGYWLYGPEYGWLWTTREDFPRVLSIDLEEWVTLL